MNWMHWVTVGIGLLSIGISIRTIRTQNKARISLGKMAATNRDLEAFLAQMEKQLAQRVEVDR